MIGNGRENKCDKKILCPFNLVDDYLKLSANLEAKHWSIVTISISYSIHYIQVRVVVYAIARMKVYRIPVKSKTIYYFFVI